MQGAKSWEWQKPTPLLFSILAFFQCHSRSLTRELFLLYPSHPSVIFHFASRESFLKTAGFLCTRFFGCNSFVSPHWKPMCEVAVTWSDHRADSADNLLPFIWNRRLTGWWKWGLTSVVYKLLYTQMFRSDFCFAALNPLPYLRQWWESKSPTDRGGNGIAHYEQMD